MRSSQIRILFVEDSPADVDLEKIALRDAGVEFCSEMAATADAVERALREFKPDVVISDLSPVRLDGLAALRLTQAALPGTPFIVVSAAIGEERAVQILREGATDYVAKDRLGRLGPAVRRALAEAQDHADRVRLEAELLHSQKMEGLGLLAGGVAHDFNNLLTVLMGAGARLTEGLAPNHPLRKAADEVVMATERGAALTRQLLLFSRRDAAKPRVLDLNVVIRNLENMLRRLIGAGVEVRTRLAPELQGVFADPGQIEQVLMNLAVNARDSMPRGGKLEIATANVRGDAAVGLAGGTGVEITVSDTGCGIEPENLPRLFEPFFTTKPPGKGTGLGLSTAYAITRRLGGVITARSEPGKGTTFRLLLPPAIPPLASPARPPADVKPSEGGETVLVIEDENAVRTLVRAVLESAGYVVVEARDGRRGLSALCKPGRRTDLVIADLVASGPHQGRLSEDLRAARPGVPILGVSGYSEEEAVLRGLLRRGTPYLSKPFTPASLLQKVREALAARGESALG